MATSDAVFGDGKVRAPEFLSGVAPIGARVVVGCFFVVVLPAVI